ncbi:hypothetical protein CRUP_020478 [Coryphaenoides rupestris]|nr:hypothetical protein CRUP_020478 [Coryphaenoides rupestris]
MLRDGRQSSLNTGLVTLQNYGTYLPTRHVQLTLAHELGHSLGAPHDEGSNCGNLGSSRGKGRYLMFPQATDEIRENNERFSACSIKHISKILRLKKDDCFVGEEEQEAEEEEEEKEEEEEGGGEGGGGRRGRRRREEGEEEGEEEEEEEEERRRRRVDTEEIVEDGEECDIGHNDTDLCCYSAREAVGRQCRLKPGKVCSPSQGLCCGQACTFKQAGESCDEETECQRESVCSGLSPLCPEPSPKENFTICSLNTRVCLNGQSGNQPPPPPPRVAMEEPVDPSPPRAVSTDKPDTCASTTSSVLSRYFGRRLVALVPGSPCSGNRGYCDKFKVCRLLYADGPIARLKNSFLNLDDFDDAHWWAILLVILVLSAVLGCIVCLCGRTLDTSDVD